MYCSYSIQFKINFLKYLSALYTNGFLRIWSSYWSLFPPQKWNDYKPRYGPLVLRHRPLKEEYYFIESNVAVKHFNCLCELYALI